MTTATERFLKYIAVNTTSVDDAKVYPSSPNQKVLGAQIAEEMKAMGLTDVIQDEYGYVMGTIPATRDKGPTIGLISHLDTSNAVSGGPIHPAFVDYQGGDIVLNKEQDIVMTPSAFPCLNEVKGKRLIVTDGTTLLGADDKAGVAEIMTLAERLLRPDAPNTERSALVLRRMRKSGKVRSSSILKNLVPRLLILLTAEPWVNWNMKLQRGYGNYHHQGRERPYGKCQESNDQCGRCGL